MNSESLANTPVIVQSRSASAGLESSSAPTALMQCDLCDLVGGPFPAAEAAHLRAIHNRLHHGILAAA